MLVCHAICSAREQFLWGDWWPSGLAHTSSVHVEPSQSPAFFKSLNVHLLDARHCLLLGDFNCVVDSRRDVRGPGYGRTTWNAGELIRLMQHFDLVDCWTLLHSTAFEHTWQRGDSSSRLDRCYTSEFF
ncbi:hypothetical protein HPB47_013071 [Ixodes persulcatus]|uniref:Uncharacterized protein n=1 Tax=Ixodes persulcatus TaxID=34615 RepID=A0AC60NRS8_IXOPE|nr:hypothetical protein HPB47_013071 [Ixodes persulcatus]